MLQLPGFEPTNPFLQSKRFHQSAVTSIGLLPYRQRPDSLGGWQS